ncbi:MAG: hypothetical protein C0P65_012550, partial [Lysobacteraceae bacterium]
MASIKNLLIRLGVLADDIDRPVNRTTAGLRRIAREADNTHRSLTRLRSTLSALRSGTSGLGTALGGAAGALGGLGRAASSAGGHLTSLGRGAASVAGSVGGLGRAVTGTASGLAGLGGSLTRTVGSLATTGARATTTAVALSTLAAAAGSAAASGVALTSALAPAGGIVAAFPGGLLMGAAALGTLRLALSGVADAFAAAISGDLEAFLDAGKGLSESASEVAYELFQMHGAFQGLRLNAQDAFFAPLVGQMWSLLPVLNALNRGVSGLAAEFGRAALEVVRFARSSESIAAIDSIFASTRQSVAALIPALQPLLAGFRDLGVVGASWLAGLAPAFADVLARFGQFMSEAAASGRAVAWLDNALAVLKQLGALLIDLGGIMAAVLRAAESAGVGVLATLGRILDSLHAFFDSAQGQAALVAIFQALAQVGAALVPILTALVSVIASLAPHVAAIAVAIGPGLAALVATLGSALAALAPGLVAVAEGMSAAFASPALSAGAQALGQAVGGLLAAVAPLLPLLAEVAGLVGQTLAAAVQTVTPVVVTLGQALIGALSQPALHAGALALVGAIGNLVAAVAPLLPQVAQL